MARYPFPQNQRLSHLTYPKLASADDVRRAYDRFRNEIVTRDGASGFARTRRPDTPDGHVNSTVSEGIAYGMVITVMLDDQALFDDFWKYAKRWFNDNGFMRWYIAADGSRALGDGGASDAEEDMAWALVMADRQWGGRGSLDADYLSEGRALIERIYEFEVDHDRYADMFLPGDEWRGRNVFNPSYFAPNQYRVFGEATNNVAGWQRVVERGYQVLENSLNTTSGNRDNGLVPAWCTFEGAPVEAFPGAMQNYQYDSARAPFRIGQDFAFYQSPQARHYLSRISRFFAAIGADGIVDGYTLDGQPAPDPNAQQPNPGSAVFIGAAAVGAMHDARYQSFIDAAYARIRTGELLARSRYYNHCWTVLSLLMLTGNLIEFPGSNPRR